MVIKSKAKTRAKQRKGALTNWKRVGRVTIAELRRRGITGEDLRRLMWGRASISSPTKAPHVRAPPPDCVGAGLGGAAGAGVGTALSSAFNVMALPDLDFSGTDPTQKQPTPDLLVTTQTTGGAAKLPQTQTARTTITATVTPSTVTSSPGIPGVTIPATGVTATPQPVNTLGMPIATTGVALGMSPVTPGILAPAVDVRAPVIPDQQLLGVPMVQDLQRVQPTVPEEVFRDYFFELINLVETAEPNDSDVRELARLAADLSNVPEIDLNINMAAKSARKMVAGAVSGLFGVAADAPPPDSGWRRERHDHSDSDPISESVLLGRASRARRARSASRRAAPPPPHLYVPARSMYLVASESSAVESDAPWDDQPSSGNNSAIGGRRDEAARIRAARPICIQHATGRVSLVEHSLFVAGSGNGAEVESSAPAQVTIKHEKKRVRPKTARPRRNRVSPVPEASTPGSPLEPWATAPLSRLSRLIRSSSASTASLASNTSTEATPKRY